MPFLSFCCWSETDWLEEGNSSASIPQRKCFCWSGKCDVDVVEWITLFLPFACSGAVSGGIKVRNELVTQLEKTILMLIYDGRRVEIERNKKKERDQGLLGRFSHLIISLWALGLVSLTCNSFDIVVRANRLFIRWNRVKTSTNPPGALFMVVVFFNFFSI